MTDAELIDGLERQAQRATDAAIGRGVSPSVAALLREHATVSRLAAERLRAEVAS